jgi:hypothetical protein
VATFFPKKAGYTHRLNGWSLRCQHTKMSIKWKVSFWTASGDDNWIFFLRHADSYHLWTGEK